MVDTQVRPNDVTDRALISAMMLTPREKFLPKELEAIAYAEKPLETSPGRWMWAARDLGKLIEETEVEKGERVLVVAAGSGYAAAVLAAMGARVVALEDDEELVAQLSAQFADASDVTVAKGDLKTLSGVDGEFDVILVGGAVEVVPNRWLELLGEDGRLAVAVRDGTVGRARIYLKSGGVASARTPFDCTPPMLPGFGRPAEFRL